MSTESHVSVDKTAPSMPIPPKSTTIKTDKPRPHVCGICTRSFARLEHLKRHERSHTKEKPFQCTVCERCFSRRDLLLRHRQKLHASFPDSPKGRSAVTNSRRQSAASIKRENRTKSVSSADDPLSPPGMARNTSTNASGKFDDDLEAIIRNAVMATDGSLEYSNYLKNRVALNHENNSASYGGRTRHASFSAVSATSYSSNKEYEAIQKSLHPMNGPQEVGFSTPQLLPANLDSDPTAMSDLFSYSDPAFINPQLLGNRQYHENGIVDNNTSSHSASNSAPPSEDVANSVFAQHLQQAHMVYTQSHNQANGNDFGANLFQNYSDRQRTRAFSVDVGSTLGIDDDLSPASLAAVESADLSWFPPSESKYPAQGATPQSILRSNSTFSPSNQNFGYPRVDSPLSLSGASGPAGRRTSSPPIRHASNATIPAHLLTSSTSPHSVSDVTSDTQSILGSTTSVNPLQLSSIEDFHLPDLGDGSLSNDLSRGMQFNERLRAHVVNLISTPTPFNSNRTPQVPSVEEMQRYIDAYNENFGKHLPFLHHGLQFTEENVALASGMAAIGALYCFERTNSFNIFEISRSCIHIYLESRKGHRGSDSGVENASKAVATPMWLVQALVLGVIYGVFSVESLANEIAVAQANAVVSLAKSAGLHLPADNFLQVPSERASLQVKWKYFIAVQERVRTVHVVHTVVGLLTTAYNLSPALETSELRCGSPCDESLWVASSAKNWLSVLHGKDLDENSQMAYDGINFGDCLDKLKHGEALVAKIPQFTLLSLIYAVHLEIYQRRTAHHRRFFEARRNGSMTGASSNGDDPLAMDVEATHTAMRRECSWLEQEKSNIESMLRAWETTWSLSPLASLSPSSQYGPLMSDSIPLSSLAHVRLYVDLRRVKEYFWKRDFSRMGVELDNVTSQLFFENTVNQEGRQFDALMEAASYAADTISLWEKHSVKWTLEQTAVQTFFHTTIALFDCALVVSEFLHRLEKLQTSQWRKDDSVLVLRISKIMARVVKAVGPEGFDIPPSKSRSMENGFQNSVMPVELEHYRPFNKMGKCLSIISLNVTAKMLYKAHVWPFAQVMDEALKTRAMQIEASYNNS